jgi:hypothetical protein
MPCSYKAEIVGSSPTTRTNFLREVIMFVDDKHFEKEAARVFWAFVVALGATAGLFLHLGGAL